MITFRDPRDPRPADALGLSDPGGNNLLRCWCPLPAKAEVLRIVSVGKSGAVTRTVRLGVRKSETLFNY